MNLNKELFCVLATVVLIMSLAQGDAVEAGNDRLASIIQAWKKRQDSIGSFHFRMDGTDFRPKKSFTPVEMELYGGNRDDEPLTLLDTSFQVEMEFALDNRGRVRVLYRGKNLSTKKRGYVDATELSVFDGTLRKTLLEDVSFPSFHIYKGTAGQVARDGRVLPLLLLYRPLDAALGDFRPPSLRVEDEMGTVAGRPCLILNDGEDKVWVDPEREFIPLRYRMSQRGRLRQSIEIRYNHSPEKGWTPSDWTNEVFTGLDILHESVVLRVSAAEVNTALADELFDPKIPTGSWVSDFITKERYILRADGKRPISPGEFTGDNFEELLNSNPPGQGIWRTVRVLLVAVVALFLIVYAYRIVRRRAAK